MKEEHILVVFACKYLHKYFKLSIYRQIYFFSYREDCLFYVLSWSVEGDGSLGMWDGRLQSFGD